ncbi:MAG TPA: 2-phosphosulfolactate phosphatase [Pirellulales bacterium]|nr:2-phosphosulfolactate phosphatase [Pirellulales bacterium]
MYSTLSVHFLPSLTTPEELAAGVVVVIDVLRASTTITAALAAGAREVIACAEVEQARDRAAELGRRRPATEKILVAAAAETIGSTTSAMPAMRAAKPEPLLGGERGGLPIDGFDLGNSPCEYTPQVVAGRSIVFTTTNGTKALMACSASQQVLIGSFLNFSAVSRKLTGEWPIHLLCAGTRGRVTREDVLFAGALVERLAGRIVEEGAMNDEARMARDVWRHAMGNIRLPGRRANQRLAEVLKDTQGGSNLIGVGLSRDIVDASEIDLYDFVPVFDAAHWRIVRPSS